jgi:hypothetical protein
MTVIAWDGKTLAADRLSTQYSLKQTTNKIFKANINGVTTLLGITGDAVTGMKIVRHLVYGDEYPENGNSENSHAACIAIDKTGIYKYNHLDTPIKLLDEKMAFGSGQDFALACMKCGLTAIQAVEMTNTLSSACGNGYDFFTLDNDPD